MNRSYTKRPFVRTIMMSLIYSPLFVTVTSSGACAQTTQNTSYSYLYDTAGNVSQITDPLARINNQSFDPLGRIKQLVQPAPSVGGARPTINYTFNLHDQLATVSDPRDLINRYGINGLGDVVSLTSPDTGAASYSFDLAGRVSTVRDARGEVTTFQYDLLGRVKRESYGSGTPTVFEYDGVSGEAPNGVGHLTKMTDESGSTTYTYTEHGEVASKTQTVTTQGTSVTHRVLYAYGAIGSSTGKLTSVYYPSGNRVNYRYDAAGRVNMITVNPVNESGVGTNTSLEYTLLSDIEYTADGPVAAWRWGNSASPNQYKRSFDLDGRIVSYNLGDPASSGAIRTLDWDAASRVKSYMHTSSGQGANASSLDQTFEYDDLDRLTGFTANGTTQAYTYDANGNRTSASFGAGSYTNTIALTSNRLQSTSGPAPAKNNTYDLAGNLLSDGTVAYGYSARGRMSSATVGTAKTYYLYNGLGQRVSQVTYGQGNPSGALVYNENGSILGEYNSATGKATMEFIYLGDMPVGVLEHVVTGITPDQVHSVNMYNVYVDHLATPRFITRSSDDKVAWRWEGSDPFGLTPPNDNPAGLGVFTFNLRMPGQYFDKSTNLFYNYYRDYDPQTGRYIQSDPIGLAGGINTYGYVGGNPVSLADPLGLVNPGTAAGASFGTLILPGPGTFIGGIVGTGLGAWGIFEITRPGSTAMPAAGRPPRPSDMTRMEERHFDRHCSNSDDPCRAIKAAVMTAIAGARGKMENMYNDKTLFRHAHSIPNPAVTGNNTTWTGHIDDLNGRTNNIWAMITLGRKMGCDMSAETAAAMTIHTPGAPRG